MNKKNLVILSLIMLISHAYSTVALACTNYIVTKGASVDGSVMLSYAADSHTLYGELYYRPAADYPEGAMFDIYEWDTGKYLGKIKQIKHTYSVVGNVNEHQVAIGETTFGGRPELVDTTAVMDYGNLIYVTLQRAKTAREAVQIMGNFVAEYGYYSEGESFSIADKNEAWVMDLISKGPGNKGAVWVARRIPDGYICGHANHPRITSFPLNDPENCLYAKDAISFAREKGYFKGDDKDFSFSDVYAPLDFEAVRFCEIRVWSFFKSVNKDMGKYIDYVRGDNMKNRMPLWIKPDHKISVHDMMGFMRDHLEGTEFDMTKDIGAGSYGLPYRWRPLTWKVDSVEYCNERATSTQQTGFSFVAQLRANYPDPIGGINWFGVDDAASSVYVPIYCGITSVPETYAVGNGDLLTYSDHSAFWTFNFVANFCYLRYNLMMVDVKKVQSELENKFIASTPAVDMTAMELYKKDPAQAVQYLTDYSLEQGNSTVKRWQQLGQYLLVKYIDGNVKAEKDGKFLKNGYTQPKQPVQPGYPQWWYKDIIEKTGDHFKVKK
jgi:dipeptidase